MSYNPNIPQGGDDPSQSQVQLLNNFGALDTIFAKNHVAFSDTTNPGKHTKIIFNNVEPDTVPISPQSNLYTKTVGVPAKQQLFFANDTIITQLTGLVGLAASPGYVTLPGGIIIAWGHNSTNANVNLPAVIPFTFITPGGFPHACWVVTTAADSTTGGLAVTAQGANQLNFNAYAQFHNTAFSWIAIGN